MSLLNSKNCGCMVWPTHEPIWKTKVQHQQSHPEGWSSICLLTELLAEFLADVTFVPA
jgi:hypothetical protein